MPDFTNSAYAFPLAGLIIALPACIVLLISNAIGLLPIICALLTVATFVATTGALHEDGLADVADGFWGGHSRERKLEIMRDSTVGTYGVLALILGVGLRITLLGHVIAFGGGVAAALILLATASLSRFAILQPWVTQKAARTSHDSPLQDESDPNEKASSGLSVRYGAPERASLTGATLCALPAFLLLIFTSGILATLVALLVWELSILAVVRLSNQHIGGQTGDTLGATQQISELGLLLGLVSLM